MSDFKNEALERADTLLGKIVLGMAVLAGIGTFAMAIMICVGVIFRYFFNITVAWAIEWSEYLIFIDVMLAAPWVLKIDKHVRVDIISTYLNNKNKKRLNQAVSVLGIVTLGMFFYFSLSATIEDIISGVKMVRIVPIPRWVVMIFLPIMALMCILVFVRKIIVLARHKEIQSDTDYQEYEEAKANSKYDEGDSTKAEFLNYDKVSSDLLTETGSDRSPDGIGGADDSASVQAGKESEVDAG